MNIKIHRGTHQIGGCVTEYECNGWHLFVDYGEELPGGPKTGDLQVEGMTHGDLTKSALLITHYHGDHIGCITKLPKDLRIYMGKVGRDIQMELSDHLKMVDGVHQEMLDRLQTVKTFEPGKPFEWGDIKIMPVTVDHSAFDAYAFKIGIDGLSVFHTGDFRTHGFRSSKLPDVIKKFIGEVDYVVCEATNVARPDAANLPEHDLQMEYQELFSKNKGNVVYVSSTNIDRLFGLYHAARYAGRVFIIDKYQKRMAFLNEVLELDSFITSPVRTLSLGQRMRADIAASLLHSPKVLFLDEPTIGLDVVVKDNIRKAIEYINRQEKTTVILTTHDLADIELLANRIVMIDKGSNVFDGTIGELKTKYGQIRELCFETDSPNAAQALGYEKHFGFGEDELSLEAEGKTVKVRFNSSVVPVSDMLSYTLDKINVSDISVKDADIEEIIRRLYKQGVE